MVKKNPTFIENLRKYLQDITQSKEEKIYFLIFDSLYCKLRNIVEESELLFKAKNFSIILFFCVWTIFKDRIPDLISNSWIKEYIPNINNSEIPLYLTCSILFLGIHIFILNTNEIIFIQLREFVSTHVLLLYTFTIGLYIITIHFSHLLKII